MRRCSNLQVVGLNPDRGRKAGVFAVRHVRRRRDDDAVLGQVAADFRETAAFMRESGEALVRSTGITPLRALDLGCSEIAFLPHCFVRVHEEVPFPGMV